ncbi:hypothetical protein MP228_007209 [Amoeboaphelidium protococcarum]|nr:hypothetical protein MP228_007209 [Amoeboaphelidium protococcarum]
MLMLKQSWRFGSNSIPRNAAYKKLQSADVDYFRRVVGAKVLTSLGDGQQGGSDAASSDDLKQFNCDWMNKYRGESQLVVMPESTRQVQQILSYCAHQKLAVVPQGGNTGLVGGSVPVYDEVILSTSLMNKIINFDPISGVLTAQAGCILETLNDYVTERGHVMPLDLGAKGSCQIGGNVATNAGGLRLLRYGSLRGTVLGLEAVVPSGISNAGGNSKLDTEDTSMQYATVISDLKGLRKDNTGLDLRGLFIGSEGYLGVITAVSILTPPLSQSINVALLKLDSFEKVQKLYLEAKSRLAEIVSAFEFFDSSALQMVHQQMPHVRSPLPSQNVSSSVGTNVNSQQDFYVLLETSGSNMEHDQDKLQSFLSDMMDGDNDQVIVDGVLAQDRAQANQIWSIREGIPEACSKSGAVYKYDISMPVPVLYKLVEDTKQHLRQCGIFQSNHVQNNIVNDVIGYGHVGDGNLHLNVSAKGYSEKVQSCLEPWVYEWTQKHGGSISAEHGLGVMKRDYVGYSKTPQSILFMKQIKNIFDPHHIMNPYKYIV